MAAGRLRQAAFHLGQALFHDPGVVDCYTALGEVAEAAGSSGAARELFKGDGTSVFPGNAAAIIALMAAEGQVADAVELLGSLVGVHPEKPWAAAPWFGEQQIPPVSVGIAVSAIWGAVDNPAPPETVDALAPWLALARKAAADPAAGADVLCALSALARRLGAHEEAIAWCGAAEQAEKAAGRVTQQTLIMLGYAHQDAGQPERAIEVWERAVALPPKNADLLLDLVDLTHDQGDFAQSLSWAERAVAADRKGVKPRAALLAARYRAGGKGSDADRLAELVDLALAHPEVPYLRTCVSRASEGAAWLQAVPPPTEAIARAFGHLAGTESDGGRVTDVSSRATSLEAPTPTTLFHTRFPGSTIAVPDPSEPDPRIPAATDFGPPLWTYDGTRATASVPPPAPEAVDLLHRVAAGIWADPLTAYDRAAAFSKLDAADLLGLLAHMPAPRDAPWVTVQRERPLYWERLAQVWVCLGILHHRPEELWQRSARRALLLRLLFGPDDWTVDAAAFALCVAAWHDPGHRTEIADAVARRYRHAARAVGRRPTALHDPLALVVLICPGVDAGTVALARKNLDREGPHWKDPRRWALPKWSRRRDR
ncbi:tetratricopeptide repeat protein [Streptomyces sp. NPDC021020]|uniref:tetratricopeptide repeat protein n=1 Tax=Streptomyces sp. NPDC021020 TaxID=3365109 RepID=UPI0037BB743F